MPTAVARPWPSGPVVVSTPGVRPYSGWPGVFECNWRKLLDFLDRQVVAGEVQQAIQQHRPVAVGQHETIAAGPFWIGRVVAEMVAPEHLGDVGHAHRHTGVAGVGLLHGVRCQEAQCIRQQARGRSRVFCCGRVHEPLHRVIAGFLAPAADLERVVQSRFIYQWVVPYSSRNAAGQVDRTHGDAIIDDRTPQVRFTGGAGADQLRSSEFGGLVLGLFGLAILVALATYDPRDPSLNTATTRHVSNLAGPGGARRTLRL